MSKISVDLLARLEQATADQQAEVIADVLEYAANQEWIDPRTYDLALGWVFSGAFESAALTLVPEGWGWSVGDVHAISEDYEGGQPWAEIWVRGSKPTPKLDGMWYSVSGRCGINAATPALALCIAALRARI